MMMKNLLKSLGSRLYRRKMNVLSLLCGKGNFNITGDAAANKTRQDIWVPTGGNRWHARAVGLSLILLGFLSKDGVYAKLVRPALVLSPQSVILSDRIYPVGARELDTKLNSLVEIPRDRVPTLLHTIVNVPNAVQALLSHDIRGYTEVSGTALDSIREVSTASGNGYKVRASMQEGGPVPQDAGLSITLKKDCEIRHVGGDSGDITVARSLVWRKYGDVQSGGGTNDPTVPRARSTFMVKEYSKMTEAQLKLKTTTDHVVGARLDLVEGRDVYAGVFERIAGWYGGKNLGGDYLDSDHAGWDRDVASGEMIMLKVGDTLWGCTVTKNIKLSDLGTDWWNSAAWQGMRFNSEDPDFQKLPDEIKAWFIDASQPTLSVANMPTLWQAGTDYIGHISADEPSLTYSAVNVPVGMRVGADGAVTGRTPKVGTYALSVKGGANDGSEGAASMTLTIVPKVWADGVAVTAEGKVLTYKKAGQTVAHVDADGHITAETLPPYSGQLLAQPLVGERYTYEHASRWSVVSNRTGVEPNVTVNATFTRNSTDGASLDATASSIMTTAGYFGEHVNMVTDLPFATTVTDAALKDVRIKNIYLTTSGHTSLNNTTIDTSVWRIKGQTTFANLNVDGGVVWNMTKAEVKGNDLGYGALNKATNAYVANPKSTLTAQTLTLNNENILIIAYNPNDADDLAVGSKNIISTTGGMPRKFDYVFKALVDGDLLALESLTPVEDGSAGINSRISMSVTQSDHNVTLTLTQQKQHVPSTALIDITFWDRVFKENPQLAGLFFSSDTTVTQSTLQTAQQANSLLAVIANVRSILPNMVNTQKQFHQTVARSMHSSPSTSGKLHNLCNALAKEGPVAFDSEQGRVWVSPYVNVNTDDGSHGSGYGALMGAEYRNLDARYILAGFAGAGADKKDEIVDHVHSTHITAGTYAAYNPWMDGRFDALYMLTRNSVHNAMTDTYNQKGTYRNVVQTVDVMFSQVFRLDDTHTWSVRPSLGHTYIKSTTGGYTLKGDVMNNKQKTSRMSATKSISQEVYGGLGLRFDTKFNDVRMRITGVYEYGYEYRHAGKTPDITTSLYISKLTPGAANKKSRTHYISANASFLAQNDWKFIVSYNGAYSGSSKNHMIAAKFERRF